MVRRLASWLCSRRELRASSAGRKGRLRRPQAGRAEIWQLFNTSNGYIHDYNGFRIVNYRHSTHWIVVIRSPAVSPLAGGMSQMCTCPVAGLCPNMRARLGLRGLDRGFRGRPTCFAAVYFVALVRFPLVKTCQKG